MGTSTLPERLAYRTKLRLLGKPLTNDDLEHERLSNTLALGVLSSDCISSSAYGTEEILLVLIQVFGMAAYDLLLPITGVVLFVLVVVTLCYRQVVMLYTQAGGSYVVARENFGPVVAQVAAVALMLDYIVTVAVQAAAGTNAVTSLLPNLIDFQLEITVAVVALLFYMNLRGLREAGRAFAFPTYFFVGMMSLVIVVGGVKEIIGDLPQYDPLTTAGAYPIGAGGLNLFSIGAMYVLLKAFANGGSSLTGLEAISNGVSAFRNPAGPNARKTLVIMSSLLGFMVLGVSWLAHVTHAVPYESQSPTVISQVAAAAFGDGTLGHIGFVLVQVATMLILYTGANTPFNGFPFLANFVAADGFLPRWLTKRGHRLSFSNGIIVLGVVSIILLVATGAHVDKLVAFYAIGVFTGFTLAGFGMARYYSTHRGPNWRANRLLNLVVGSLALLIVLIFAVTKFTEGAWLVVVMFAIGVPALLRLRRVYVAEDTLLQALPEKLVVPRASRSSILLLVDTVDLAVVRALAYAKTLRADDLRAVHVILDRQKADRLVAEWNAQPGMTVPLQLVECPDRRITRTVVEVVSRLMEHRDGAQVTVLLPRRSYGFLGRVLHDHTADGIASALSTVPGCVATIVPFDVSSKVRRAIEEGEDVSAQATAELAREAATVTTPLAPATAAEDRRPPAPDRARPAQVMALNIPSVAGSVPIAEAPYRGRVRLTGRVRSVEVSPIAGSLQVELYDASGGIAVVFYGRRRIRGIEPGVVMSVEGTVGALDGRLAIANPQYTLLPR